MGNKISENIILSPLLSNFYSVKIPKSLNSLYFEYLKILNSTNINLSELTKLIIKSGIPSEFLGLRGIIWEVISNNLSKNSAEWEMQLKTKKYEYENLKKQFLWFNSYENECANNQNYNTDGNPIRNEVKCIYLDSVRTIINPIFSANIDNALDMMIRILAVFIMKCNGNNYLSGMSFLFLPIFKAFADFCKINNNFKEFIESELFFLYKTLLNEYKKDVFNIPPAKLLNLINNCEENMRKTDIAISNKLIELGIDFKFFAYGWILLDFCNYMEIKNVLQIWDILFAKHWESNIIQNIIIKLLISKKSLILSTAEFEKNILEITESPKKIENFDKFFSEILKLE